MVISSRRAIRGPIAIFGLLVIIAVAAIYLVMETRALGPNLGISSTPTSSGTTALRRSGPISIFPAAWGPEASCPGQLNTGNIFTFNGLSTAAYPDSWNTTTVVTLGQVYQDIINSATFMKTASGQGWVVDSWNFLPGGSTNIPPYSDDIAAYFILTNATSPTGYVTAFYDIQTGGVAMSSVDTFPYPYEDLCASTTTSTTTA